MSSTQEDTLPKEGKMSTLEELMRQKDALEAEILKLEQEIYNHGVGLTGKLVDEEGFPRADIDIPTILTLRHNFNCKRNDYKRLMEDINKALIGMHQEKRQKAQAGAQ
ncbi:26S proteasome non-ATPase regulatory subunit 9, partial [Spiromyces aspiralis]